MQPFECYFSGRCAWCFQSYARGSTVQPHKTAYRHYMHKGCASNDLGVCPGCNAPMEGAIIAVDYKRAQRRCVGCATYNKWKCAPALRKFNRLASYFEKKNS